MEKEFDAVKEMRDIRKKLQKEHEKNPALRRKRLEQIRKNTAWQSGEKKTPNHNN